MQDDQDVKDAVEAAFGPGAFELIAEMESEEMTAAEEIAGVAATLSFPQPPAADQDLGLEKVSDQLEPEPKRKQQQTAQPQTAQPQTAQPQTLLLFELADARFGVALANIVEIQNVPRVTRIRRGPKWLRGLANLRGSVISVVDLQLLLGRSSEPSRNADRLVVVRSDEDANLTGLIVDSVLGLHGVAADAVMKTAATDGTSDHFVHGMIECEDRSVTVLDLERLLRSSEMRRF